MKALRTNTSVILLILLVSCGQWNKNTIAEKESSCEKYSCIINKCLINLFHEDYISGEVTITFYDYISVDDSNTQDIRLLGNFWLINYIQSGDTLKKVSGGNQPGEMHIRMVDKGKYEWISFGFVNKYVIEDDYENNAKRVFGEHYDEYLEAQADLDRRQIVQSEAIADYVHNHGLSAKYYQDKGQPAIKIPFEE